MGWPLWLALSAKRLENSCVKNVFLWIVRYGHGGAVSIFPAETVNVSRAEWHVVYN